MRGMRDHIRFQSPHVRYRPFRFHVIQILRLLFQAHQFLLSPPGPLMSGHVSLFLLSREIFRRLSQMTSFRFENLRFRLHRAQILMMHGEQGIAPLHLEIYFFRNITRRLCSRVRGNIQLVSPCLLVLRDPLHLHTFSSQIICFPPLHLSIRDMISDHLRLMRFAREGSRSPRRRHIGQACQGRRIHRYL